MRKEAIEVEILRNETIESRHFVDAIVTDDKGHTIETYGDTERATYARSMIKPIQALPFVLSCAHEDAPDAMKAIALSCASHASEHIHIDFIREWHRKLGIDTEQALACGPQNPDDETVFFEIIRAHEKPKRINNNCSGKHTGMIATAIKLGFSYTGYESYDHDIQKEVRRHLSAHSGIDHDKVSWGVDGCGIPTYAIPQAAIAKMMSALHGTSEALGLIRQATARHPYLFGGHGWVDSEITAITGGRIFSKVGAEGNYAAVLYDEGKTIVLKARDGAFRAAEAALMALLEKHARMKNEEREKIRAHATPPLKNWAGTEVGSIRTRV
jgi:L-asparaginase II